jgi:hypothetical protein
MNAAICSAHKATMRVWGSFRASNNKPALTAKMTSVT